MGGLNTYGYVFANPLIFFDPTGLECRFLGRDYLSVYSIVEHLDYEIYEKKQEAPGARRANPSDCVPSPGPPRRKGRLGTEFPCSKWNFEPVLYVFRLMKTVTQRTLKRTFVPVYECDLPCGGTEIVRQEPVNDDLPPVILDTDYWFEINVVTANENGFYE